MLVDRFEVGDRVRAKKTGQTGTLTFKQSWPHGSFRLTWDEGSVRYGSKDCLVTPLALTYWYDRIDS